MKNTLNTDGGIFLPSDIADKMISDTMKQYNLYNRVDEIDRQIESLNHKINTTIIFIAVYIVSLILFKLF
jgi:hypothetical protein